MPRLRQFAGPTVAILFLTLGLAGCAHERHHEIPADALMVAEGDRQLSFRAVNDGRVYIYDVDRDRLVYAGDLQRGQMVTLDAERDRIQIDRRTVFEEGIGRGNRHRIFFDRQPLRRVIVEPQSETEIRVEPRSETEIRVEPRRETEIRVEPRGGETEIKIDRD